MNDKQNTSATARNTAVIVLGMHRSGTSALAGLLHELGLAMGPSLMPGRADENEKGFWEHEKIVSIHDRLLAYFGSGWSDPMPLPQGWVTRSFSRQCQDEICQILEEDSWSQPLFLCIVRNPLEVVASLQHRDWFSPLIET